MKYYVVEELGRGGFGIVESVRDESGNLLARKRFSPSPSIPRTAHPKLLQRFKREVKTQQALGGHEILPVLDFDFDTDEPWFTMPLADKTYEQQISEDRRTGKATVSALADIMAGLQQLHDLGYVHRDLNPKNILLHDGKWKLSDLGAVLPPSGHTVTLTEDTIIYTEQYCSPEQRNDFHKAQAPSDVFSFGCVLHDLFGTPPRRPYAQQSAPGDIGLVIQKCTEINPTKRPKVSILRTILFDAVLEKEGACKVDDSEAESWLARLANVETWPAEEFDDFARYFGSLDLGERTTGHEACWVDSASTPFMSHLPQEALVRIVSRQDGISGSIVDKYCEWAMTTSFAFEYSDTICVRMLAIFDHGTASDKARAVAALARVGSSHNRWYVMRSMLRCCSKSKLSRDEAKRIYIEITTDELQSSFRRCVEGVAWDLNDVHAEVAKLLSK